MTQPTSMPNGDDELLVQFQLEYEAAVDRAATLASWCGRHTRLARQLRARAGVLDALHRARPQTDEAIPTQLGEFKIVRRIGASMGEVYDAWQPSLKRRVAIKTIRRGRISPQARDRFLREQRVLAGLHQTHIVPIYAAGEEAGLQYFVMPFIDGAPLHHVVSAARTWTTSQADQPTPSLKEIACRVVDASSRPDAARAYCKKEELPVAPLERHTNAPHASLPVPLGIGIDGDGSGQKKVERSTFDFGSAGGNVLRSSILLDHSRASALSLEYFRSVAQLMADAADALQYAHDAKIIHRDLKPSNLMVDRQGHCCIIDFGLAAFLGQARNAQMHDAPDQPEAATVDVAEQSTQDPAPALTGQGVMGTPPYMAPEQWDPNHTNIDGRTDVYGMGVTMYELLTLQRAYDGDDNEKIKDNVLAGNAPKPRDVTRAVPTDLDAICRKAIAKEPGRRYQCPQELAEDLRRWLGGQPTLARPAWWPRRLFLWAKRNKGWAAAIILLLVSVTVGGAALGVIQERNREADRQILLRQAQSRRLNVRAMEWSHDAWALLGQAAKLRVDGPLRNEASSSLIGLDAVRVKEFNNEGACSLAFNASGSRLILGAQPARKNANEPKKPRQPIRVWNREIDQVRETRIFDEGPVAFDKTQKALALTAHENSSALVVWDLDKEERVRELKLPPKTKGNLESWVLSADGATAAAATATLDGSASTIYTWDVATGNLIREIPSNPDCVLALSPDGTALAVAVEAQVQICDLQGAKETQSWKASRLPISALAFGPNPRRSPRESPWVLATGNHGGTITLWDLADRSIRRSLQGSPHHVLALAFSQDGAWLASSGRSEPHVWNAATGQLRLELPFHDFATALVFAPAGDQLAMANQHSPFGGLDIRVVRLESGRGLKSLTGVSGQIEFVEFSKDGSIIAALSHEWEIGVWATKSGRLLHVFLPRSAQWVDNAGLAISDDNQTIALTTNQQAHLWDMKNGKEQTFALPPGMVDRLAFHTGLGKFLSFRVETKGGKEWPLASKTDFREHPRVCRLRTLAPGGFNDAGEISDFNCSIDYAAMARNGSAIAVRGFADGQNGLTRALRVYSLPERRELMHVPTSAKNKGVRGTYLDPEGNTVFSSSVADDGRWIQPKLVNLKTQSTLDWQYFAECLSPGGNLAIARDIDAANRCVGVRLHRGPNKTPLATFATNLASSIQFSRAGDCFAWGATDGTVIVCDIAATQAKLAEARLGW